MRFPLRHRDQGFTLIELLVAVIVIGVLSSIAVPVYLSQRDKAANGATRSQMRALINEIHLARENEQRSLISITGTTWSGGVCVGAVPKVSDPGFGTSGCGIRWNSTVSAIATASGTPLTTAKKLFTDGWGRPIVVDENESESGGYWCTAPDTLRSAGPDGINSGGMTPPAGSDDIQMSMTLSGFKYSTSC